MDEQLDVMTALSFIHLSQKHVSRAPPARFYREAKPRDDGGDDSEDLPSRMVSILSWIAVCLVRDAQGDAVAAALSVLSGTITLYLSRTRGPPDDQDITNSRALLSALRHAMAEKDASLATDTLFKTTVSMSYRRFAAKVGAIARMESVPSRVPDRFNDIVDKWVASGGTESDPSLLSFAREQRLGTETHGAAALKLVFGQLINLIERGLVHLSSGIETCVWAQGYCRCALALVYSSFFTQFGTGTEGLRGLRARYGAADFTWVLKLLRRLWRVARYRVDAWSFATYGFQFIRDALGERGVAEFLEHGKDIEVAWVAAQQPGVLPANHGRTYALPEPPLPRLSSTLERYGFGSLELDETKPAQQEFADSVRRLWPAGGAVARIHCEIQLISYFEQNDTPVHRNYIGVSKLSCWACHAYIEQVNKQRMEPWIILGTSNKANYGWLVPPNPFGLSVIYLIRDELKEALAKIAKTYGTRETSDDGSSSDSDESQLSYLDVASR